METERGISPKRANNGAFALYEVKKKGPKKALMDLKGLKMVYFWPKETRFTAFVEHSPSGEMILYEVRFRGSPTIKFALQ